jgi:hypothetical protein
MTLEDLKLDPFVAAVIREAPEPMASTLAAELREVVEEKVRAYFADPDDDEQKDALDHVVERHQQALQAAAYDFGREVLRTPEVQSLQSHKALKDAARRWYALVVGMEEAGL